MEFVIHLLSEPDHLMWLLGMFALVTGKAHRWNTVLYGCVGLVIIVGHAVLTGG